MVYVGEGNRVDEEVNRYFQKREEHRVTYTLRGRSTQLGYPLFVCYGDGQTYR